MKKLLTLLGSVGLIASTSAAVVACGDRSNTEMNNNVDSKPTSEEMPKDPKQPEAPKDPKQPEAPKDPKQPEAPKDPKQPEAPK
ncbi:lipoprotein [Mycoplasma capricolum]|nr:lipoprotein [Mycoplasma capricolum]